MKSGASAELFTVGRPSSLAGLFGDSSCRLPFLYCSRERCRTKLVRAVLLLLMITFRYACWEPCCRWEEEVVGQMPKNYKFKDSSLCSCNHQLILPPQPSYLVTFSLKSKILKYKKSKIWRNFFTMPYSYLAIIQIQYMNIFHFLVPQSNHTAVPASKQRTVVQCSQIMCVLTFLSLANLWSLYFGGSHYSRQQRKKLQITEEHDWTFSNPSTDKLFMNTISYPAFFPVPFLPISSHDRSDFQV